MVVRGRPLCVEGEDLVRVRVRLGVGVRVSVRVGVGVGVGVGARVRVRVRVREDLLHDAPVTHVGAEEGGVPRVAIVVEDELVAAVRGRRAPG